MNIKIFLFIEKTLSNNTHQMYISTPIEIISCSLVLRSTLITTSSLIFIQPKPLEIQFWSLPSPIRCSLYIQRLWTISLRERTPHKERPNLTTCTRASTPYMPTISSIRITRLNTQSSKRISPWFCPTKLLPYIITLSSIIFISIIISSQAGVGL